jgi:hypothetical protein
MVVRIFAVIALISCPLANAAKTYQISVSLERSVELTGVTVDGKHYEEKLPGKLYLAEKPPLVDRKFDSMQEALMYAKRTYCDREATGEMYFESDKANKVSLGNGSYRSNRLYVTGTATENMPRLNRDPYDVDRHSARVVDCSR